VKYADVILPLALPNRTYTYAVPEDLAALLRTGVRVEVQFGKNKLYSGLVERLHNQDPNYRLKPVLAVLDEVTLVSPEQLRLWDWLAEYYCCTLGEVMLAAMPGHLKLSSETKLVANPEYQVDSAQLDDNEYLISEALQIQPEITVEDARKILQKKTIFPVIQRLLAKGVLFLREDLVEKFKPKKVGAVRLSAPLREHPEQLREVFAQLDKSERQLEVLMAYIHLSKQAPYVLKQEVLNKADVSESTLRTLIKKGILEIYEKEVSRVAGFEDLPLQAGALTQEQTRACSQINAHFLEKNVVLLHGITGSGKTRIYIELIQKTIQAGGQVLYLLPEIALTTQMTSRLKAAFGQDVSVYHSKINYQERTELWRSATEGKPLIMAARSGLFLPFRNLQLIIVDEEHDNSYKQYDPAPRYNARDTAVYLAGLCNAKVLLGTATPAVESYFNALSGKYGLVTLTERYGGLQLPNIGMVDLREEKKSKRMQGIFSQAVIDALKHTLAQGEQAILFQNRRGYSPMLECQVCGWTAQCRHCDVSLTFHKFSNSMRCHYCGYKEEPATVCPACGSGKIALLGFGTEKIEDELSLFLPEARTGRLDMDTAGTKNKLAAILNDFEEKRIDVLVGTQMVTKGLDFEHVGLVGVLGADQLVGFPDFRAGERAYQMLTQVAGRAGRKNKQGRVLIQSYNPAHPVLKEVQSNDFESFIKRELEERKAFKYPPFYRLIHLTLRHKEENTAREAAEWVAKALRSKLGERVLGPVQPAVPRVRGLYAQEILLKLEKNADLIARTKQLLKYTQVQLNARKGMGQVIFSIDVDPM
jgi:primosomal protein N' (replication factor Y) (superfamily II helicase)